MKVAILIATYGEEHWEKLAKERALPSVWGQGADEVLCAHHRLGPIATARNELARETDTEWLCFLDADDELAPGYLGAMKRALEQAGDGPVLLTPAVSYVRKGQRGQMRADKPRFLDRGIPLSDDNWLVVGTLIRRDLFLEVGGFSDYPHGFEDWSLWAKAWAAGARIIKVPDAVYRAWVNPLSAHRLGWRDHKWQREMHMRVRAELFPELT